MGIERTITLWYLHRQMLLQELASLEAQLVQIPTDLYSEVGQTEIGKGASSSPTDYVEIEKQCKRVQERLHNLGPCPRPMMG